MATAKRRFVIGAMLALCCATRSLAADWPTSPITIVVPYTAGGNTDIMARLLADSLGRQLGQAVVVDNRGGAGGAIATEYVARANKDGYTLLFASSAQLSVVPFVQRVRYDPSTSFAPISIYGKNSAILATSARLPATNVKELIAYARSHPNEINYGSGGVGSIAHLSGAIFAKRAGVEMQHVPYKGGSQTVTELMAGQIQMYIGNTSEILPLAESKEIKLLAICSEERLRDLPDLPTVSETVPGFVVEAWNGLLAPAGVPKARLDRLEAAAIKAAKDPEVVSRLKTLGIIAQGSTASEFSETLKSEAAMYREAVTTAGIKVE